MSRPKGSKNKKPLVAMNTVDEKIAAEQANKDKLEAEQLSIQEEIKNLRQRLKENKKAICLSEKNLTALQAKKDEAAALESALAEKAEIERVVNAMLSSGKTIEEIKETVSN